MKRALSIMTLFAVLFGSVISLAAAQATPSASPVSAASGSPFVSGLNTPATLYSADGGPVATITVTAIERNWDKYEDDFYAPETGQDYVALTVEVSNTSQSTITMSSSDVYLYDQYGRRYNIATPPTSDRGPEVFEGIDIAPGSTVNLLAVFSVYSNSNLGAFQWATYDGPLAQVLLLGN